MSVLWAMSNLIAICVSKVVDVGQRLGRDIQGLKCIECRAPLNIGCIGFKKSFIHLKPYTSPRFHFSRVHIGTLK